MLYRKITVGENLESLHCEEHFQSLFDVDFDFLVNLGKETPTILFIDGGNYSKDILSDWVFAFTNIILRVSHKSNSMDDIHNLSQRAMV